MTGVLAGVRVLDLWWGVAGPAAAMLLCTHGAEVTHGGVIGRRKQEDQTDGPKHRPGPVGRKRDVHPESFQDVGRTGSRGVTAVPVFRHTHAGASHYEGRSG